MKKKHEMLDKVKGFIKDHGVDILLGTGMLISGTVMVYSFGYYKGACDMESSIAKGIEKVWNDNPGLKETMWDSIATTMLKEASKS